MDISENTETSSNTEKISKIREYEQQGYVFHGSPYDLEIIEPKPSKDSNKENTFNTDTAIFGSHNPQVCIFSLLDPQSIKNFSPGLSWSAGTGKDGNITARIPQKIKPLVESYSGFLYVLEPTLFTKKKGWTLKSYDKIEPTDKIPITFEDFTALGGKVEWKDNNI
jgi:hypothetical protein